MPSESAAQTDFRNVDLDIRAQSGLQELLEGLKDSIYVMNNETQGFASVELLDVQPESIDHAVRLYFDLVQALSPRLRNIWDNCEIRCMNIGVQAGTEPYSKLFNISRETISLLSSIHADVVFTVYAFNPNS